MYEWVDTSIHIITSTASGSTFKSSYILPSNVTEQARCFFCDFYIILAINNLNFPINKLAVPENVVLA